MTSAVPITESQIRAGASAESFRRGQDYYRNGAVISLTRRGQTLEAEVEGSQYEPYRVTIELDQAGVTAAVCSCPYDWGGWCKHIVAVLLAALDAPGEVEVRSALADLLATLDREQLLALITALAKRNPGLTDQIEAQIEVVRALSEATTTTAILTQAAYDVGQEPLPAALRPAAARAADVRREAVDVRPFRQQVRRALHSVHRLSRSEAYRQINGVIRQIVGLVKQATAFAHAGDGRNALAILEAITDEYIEEWMNLDDPDGITSGFFANLTEPWLAAILTADLTAEERAEWANKLEDWQIALRDYDLAEVFKAPLVALEEGWDAPHVQAALRGDAVTASRHDAADEGEADDAWADEDEDGRESEAAAGDYVANQVTRARLAVLAQQGRTVEYLNLARATGQTIALVTTLIALGRAEEAMAEARHQLRRSADALAVARAFREQNDPTAALHIAEHGLLLAGPKHDLADWLSDLAHGLGQHETALRAAMIAFREYPSETGYLKVRERALAAGKSSNADNPQAAWLPLRDELLAFIRAEKGISSDSKIGIFLREGLLADAIAVADTSALAHSTLKQLMDAACATRPAWVIEAAQRKAEAIMDVGQAQYYEDAVVWLERAQAAYRIADRLADWRAYLRSLRVRHSRKYKLMSLLDRLNE